MNRADALRVLRKLSAYQPSMPVDEYTGEVWAEGLADLDGPDILADALDAVTTLCRANREPGRPWLVELRDIRHEVVRVRHLRVAARQQHISPPSGLDAAAYQRGLADSSRELSARDWTPPPAIEAGRHDPRPAITALANAYAPEENR